MIKKEILDFFMPVFKKNKLTFVLLSISWFIYWITWVLTPYLLKLETDQLVDQKSYNFLGNNIWPIKIYAIILIAILISNFLNQIITRISEITIRSKERYFENSIKISILRRYKDMEIWKSMNSRFENLKSIIDGAVEDFASSVIKAPWDSLNFIISITWLSILYYIIDIKLLFIIIFFNFLWYLINKFSDRIAKKFELEDKFIHWRMLNIYSDLLTSNFNKLAISGWVWDTINKFDNFLENDLKRNNKKNWESLFRQLGWFVNENFLNIILKFIVWYGVFIWTKSVWTVVFTITSMDKIDNITRTIIYSKRRIKEFKFTQETISLFLKITQKVWITKYSGTINKIEYKNVDFCYPNLWKYEIEYINNLEKTYSLVSKWFWYIDERVVSLTNDIKESIDENQKTILNNINISLETWKIYWIVWRNWAWKSTLMYLLAWFFRNYTWEILVNDNVCKDFDYESLTNKVSFLSQEPFSMWWWTTIYDNITLWVENIDIDKIWHYLKLFWLEKKIKKLKNWLKEEIWRNINFSGWETQILAFIRLLLQDKEIIIMDEGTNQLDAENEVLVMNELLKQKDKKIIIFITHRMSTISKADVIYCLENGEIKHFWTHKELLWKNDNIYATFYKTQILHDNI